MTRSSAQSQFNLKLCRNFFDAETCREIISEMQSSPGGPALTYGKGDLASIDERVRKLSRLMPSPQTVQYVIRRLMEYGEKIEEFFRISIKGCEDPQFLRYRVGDFFVAHQDGNTGLLQLDTDRFRRVSVSIFLNHQSERPEPDAYGGGSLVFSDWRSGGKCRIDGETGTLVSFPSQMTHEVVPVTHGERYSIVSWYG